jgi:hypothetical protein
MKSKNIVRTKVRSTINRTLNKLHASVARPRFTSNELVSIEPRAKRLQDSKLRKQPSSDRQCRLEYLLRHAMVC